MEYEKNYFINLVDYDIRFFICGDFWQKGISKKQGKDDRFKLYKKTK